MSTEIVKQEERAVEFVPFGGGDKIKLSCAIVRKFVAGKTKAGAEPTDVDCMKFIMLCKARGLNPWEGDAYLQGYDTRDGAKFTLITAHQSFLKRAEANPAFAGMESGVTVKRGDEVLDYEGDMVIEGDTLIGGWSRVHRADRTKPTYRRVALKTFNTGMSRWEKDPAGMIVKCAEADGLRSAFPNSTGGMYLAGEAQPVIDIADTPKRPTVEFKAPSTPDDDALAKRRVALVEALHSAGINVETFLDSLNERFQCRAAGIGELNAADLTEIETRMDVKEGRIVWK